MERAQGISKLIFTPDKDQKALKKTTYLEQPDLTRRNLKNGADGPEEDSIKLPAFHHLIEAVKTTGHHFGKRKPHVDDSIENSHLVQCPPLDDMKALRQYPNGHKIGDRSQEAGYALKNK